MGRDRVRDRAHEVGRVRLAARAEIGGLELVEVRRDLEPHVFERADVVERVDAARRPQRDPRLLERRQRRKRQILRVPLVGGAEHLGLAPDDVLEPEPQPQPVVERLEVEVRLLELLGALLTRAAVPRARGLAEVEHHRVEVARAQRLAQPDARQVEALRVEQRGVAERGAGAVGRGPERGLAAAAREPLVVRARHAVAVLRDTALRRGRERARRAVCVLVERERALLAALAPGEVGVGRVEARHHAAVVAAGLRAESPESRAAP